jgi:antitoxin component YwqK of YwqJK toxin-antitoxin module
MKTILRFSFFITIIFCENLFAQPRGNKPDPVKVTFYYNAVWELTTKENSLYRREAYFDLTGMVFDGVYNDYDRNDKLIADGIYSHGIKSGIHTEYADHKVKTKIEYSGNDFTIWEWNDGKTEGVKNGNGKFSTLFFYFATVDGMIVPKEGAMEGEFRNGRRVGKWLYYDLNKFKTDAETYNNGKLLRRVNYTKRDSVLMQERKSVYFSLGELNTEVLMHDKGAFEYLNQYFEKYITYPTSFSRNVTYPAGLKRLLTLFAQAMMAPEDNLELIRLKVNSSGKIEKAVLARSINATYDNLTEEILDIHKNRFFPAIKNGLPVASVIYLPVGGGEKWMQALQDMPTEWFLDSSNFY